MDQFQGNFSYQPLAGSEIRLFEIDRGSWDDPVVCHLTHEWLEDSPVYSALSYVWGDPNDTLDVTLNGVSFPVTRSLHTFLRRLRQPRRSHRERNRPAATPNLFWADAVCINQADKHERATQVKRMFHIYSEASTVYGYLGEYGGNNIDRIPAVWKKAEDLFHDLFEPPAELSEGGNPTELLSRLSHEDQAVLIDIRRDLTQLQFFKRIWIVQELLAPTSLRLIYGSIEIKGIYLFGMVPHLLQLGDSVSLPPDNTMLSWVEMFAEHVGRTAKHGHAGIAKHSVEESKSNDEDGPQDDFAQKAEFLLELLITTSNLASTEPRDKLYALLGLCQFPLLPPELEPNYDLPLNEVFFRYNRWLMRHVTNHTILDFELLNAKGFPSWCTNLQWNLWTRARSSWTLSRSIASDLPNTRPSLSIDGRTLFASGLRLGMIETVEECVALRLAVKLLTFKEDLLSEQDQYSSNNNEQNQCSSSDDEQDQWSMEDIEQGRGPSEAMYLLAFEKILRSLRSPESKAWNHFLELIEEEISAKFDDSWHKEAKEDKGRCASPLNRRPDDLDRSFKDEFCCFILDTILPQLKGPENFDEVTRESVARFLTRVTIATVNGETYSILHDYRRLPPKIERGDFIYIFGGSVLASVLRQDRQEFRKITSCTGGRIPELRGLSQEQWAEQKLERIAII